MLASTTAGSLVTCTAGVTGAELLATAGRSVPEVDRARLRILFCGINIGLYNLRRMAARFRLAAVLESRGMTQSELSRRSGVTLPTINRMCTNKAKGASLRVLDRLAVVLRIRPGDLITRGETGRSARRRR